ncbi:hypothetical protein EVAR_53161_1 [Eumeta japonica]|uniref:Uncharacterized protein n=1 Tax=Eumeta variegata TaxID=151549 RepID=A0A4C1YU45_EUMVA|nr:hypothetical protein EVAR_53161_1 [Eumeta japonica]
MAFEFVRHGGVERRARGAGRGTPALCTLQQKNDDAAEHVRRRRRKKSSWRLHKRHNAGLMLDTVEHERARPRRPPQRRLLTPVNSDDNNAAQQSPYI